MDKFFFGACVCGCGNFQHNFVEHLLSRFVFILQENRMYRITEVDLCGKIEENGSCDEISDLVTVTRMVHIWFYLLYH